MKNQAEAPPRLGQCWSLPRPVVACSNNGNVSLFSIYVLRKKKLECVLFFYMSVHGSFLEKYESSCYCWLLLERRVFRAVWRVFVVVGLAAHLTGS